MTEQTYLKDFYVKGGNYSVINSQNTLFNNPYCREIMKGLGATELWSVKDGKTEFATQEAEKDFKGVLNIFFRRYYINGKPEMTGSVKASTTDISFKSECTSFSAKNEVPITWTRLISTATVFPIQFFTSAENFEITTTNTDFKVRDMLWFVLRPGGFILSFSAETFGVFVGLMSDLIYKTSQNKDLEKGAQALFKMSVQEAMFNTFAKLYLYLKTEDLLSSSVLPL